MMDTNTRRGLAAIVGAVAAAGLYHLTPSMEGTKLKTYRDIAGIFTYCTGATENAVWGKTYTLAECQAQLDKDLAKHAEGVMACIHVPMTDGQKIAYVDAAYNIGVSNFCSSSMARYTNAGRPIDGCNSLPKWNKADGHVVRGLTIRREVERQYCLGNKK